MHEQPNLKIGYRRKAVRGVVGSKMNYADELKKKPTPGKKGMSLLRVSQLLGITELTAIRWLRAGRFQGVSWTGTRWAFDPDFKVLSSRRALASDELVRRTEIV